MSFSQTIKTSIGGDEYYSPENAVEMILPVIRKRGFHKIWCPFDTSDSNFVKLLGKEFDVVHGHISTGQDFFDFVAPPPEVECVISNPPFSKRDSIFERLYEWQIPFALIMNMNGIFDSKKRYELFKDKKVEFLIPKGRMKFFTPDGTAKNSPNFQSIYICSQMLDKQIEFSESEF